MLQYALWQSIQGLSWWSMHGIVPILWEGERGEERGGRYPQAKVEVTSFFEIHISIRSAVVDEDPLPEGC